MNTEVMLLLLGFFSTNILAIAGLWVKIERRLTIMETHMTQLIKIHDNEMLGGKL